MSDIVLTTLNAKYIHAAFGLRYLLANSGGLRPRTCIAEFDINQRPVDIAEALLAREPKLIGFGIYIWNAGPTTEVVAAIRRVRPETVLVLGGPEVSYETEGQAIVDLADYVITGEADLKFAEVATAILSGLRPPEKIIAAELPDLEALVLPYDLYEDGDVAHRIVYVEASRGCPFKCEFCLSSLDIPVRQFPLGSLLDHLQDLLDRGARQLKFVDRTFNLHLQTSQAILEFLLDRYVPGLLFHFEMIPDRLPAPLRDLIARFPPGALQFEVGVQTFNPEVSERIHRAQDYHRLEENLRYLRQETGVHLHADLIAGLPGESLESFAAGFDRLVALRPHEIQVGILKRLRGTPIARHDTEWQMVYNPYPPYEILQNRSVGFREMQSLRRFARYWDLVGNSGNFVETAPLIWAKTASPFHGFMRFSEWLYRRVRRTDGVALVRLMQFVFEFVTRDLGVEAPSAARALWRDYQRGGRRDKPGFLKDYLAGEEPSPPQQAPGPTHKRQARHLGPRRPGMTRHAAGSDRGEGEP